MATPIRRKKISKKIEKDFKKEMESQEDYYANVKPKEIDPNSLVPTGSTTFNLECSGRVEGAFVLGKLANIIGDSHSGKTLFALTIFAECSMQKRFDNYRFIYDDVEAANEFDIPYLFGRPLANRIEETGPVYKNGLKLSKTVEDFNDNIARALEGDKPFIYVLDSFDGLTTEAAIEKDIENRKKREKGNQTTGSYGDGKPKIFSDFCKNRIQDLAQHKSVIIIISQTRDNIGFGAMFTPKIRSGGRALKFYAFHEVWLACQKKEKSGKRTIVTNVQAKITKNKLTGKHGEAYFPILFDYGVDNISSCINFLIDEGNWSGTKASLNTQGFVPKKVNSKQQEVFRSMKETISYIEKANLEEKLFKLCQETHDNIMNGLRPQRKRKY